MTPHHLLEIIVDAETAWDAEVAAKAWAAHQPGIRLVRLARVRPAAMPAAMIAGNDWHDKWAVELAYANVEPGLGL